MITIHDFDVLADLSILQWQQVYVMYMKALQDEEVAYQNLANGIAFALPQHITCEGVIVNHIDVLTSLFNHWLKIHKGRLIIALSLNRHLEHERNEYHDR